MLIKNDPEKKVLITGGAGFLGSQIVFQLLDEGYSVGIIIRSSTNISRLDSVKDEVSLFDISTNSLDEIVSNFNPEIVIHTAVIYGKKEDSFEVYQTNLNLFVELFRASVKTNVSHFINSDTFSGKNENYAYLKAYHLSKKHALEWSKIFSLESEIKFSNMRIEHLYGENDSTNKFVPFIINSINSNKNEINLTNGLQKRDFVNTKDAASAYVMVLQKQTDKFVEYELGTGVSHSIRELVELIKKLAENTITQLNFGVIPMRKGEFEESKADISLLEKIGWQPEYNLEKGIKEILDRIRDGD